MLYFAYGSNLNISQMARRCPAARPVRRFIFPELRLVFRGVADVEHDPAAECGGGIWKITPACERALDTYEGYRPENPEGGLYRKVIVELAEPIDGETQLMFYKMNSEGIWPPSEGYYRAIEDGYRNFRLASRRLRAALEHSYNDKAPSHIERRRYMAKGRPRLAARPSLQCALAH